MIAKYFPEPVAGAEFLRYLEDRLGIGPLWYVDEPEAILDGWETYTYRFRIGSRAALPRKWRRPLILRIYASAHGLSHLRHEYAVQTHMNGLGYPIAEPLLWEKPSMLYDGPFFVMRCLPGRTLLDLMLNQPWRIINGPRQLATEQVHLHRLSAEGFPDQRVPFPERHLEETREWIDRFDLVGLEPGMRWLTRNCPRASRDRRIIHLDYHPLNVLWHHGRCSGVLDWSESTVGDREADVATTLVLLQMAPVELSNRLHRVFAVAGRWALWRLYLENYRRRLPLDRHRLSYYMALTALRRLACAGAWLQASPRVTGCKPSSVRHLNALSLQLLESCFELHSGVNVRVECRRRGARAVARHPYRSRAVGIAPASLATAAVSEH